MDADFSGMKKVTKMLEKRAHPPLFGVFMTERQNINFPPDWHYFQSSF